MQFTKITLDDINLIKPYLQNIDVGICDYTLGGMIMWRDYYSMEKAIEKGVLYTRLYNKNGEVFYNIPLGISIKQGIENLKEHVKGKIKFCTIPENMLFEFFAENKNAKTYEQRDFADYVYLSKDLSELKGKKYSGQRNMVHQFLRENPNWSYEEISNANVDNALDFLLMHYKVSSTATDFEKEEENKVIEVLKNNGKFNFFGSLLKTNGETVGFSLAEKIGDTVYIHIEKANRNVKGAYQMLVNQFALKYTANVTYVNREEDVGDLGLRESKLSYHPFGLLKKYIVEI